MTSAMIKALEAEISFMENWLEYPDDDLELMKSLDDAQCEIDGILESYDGSDFPDGLKDAETMLLVWNYVVGERLEVERLERLVIDDDVAKKHPDWLRFRNRYADGTSVFIDTEELAWQLVQRMHFDQEHVDVILEAVEKLAAAEK